MTYFANVYNRPTVNSLQVGLKKVATVEYHH